VVADNEAYLTDSPGVDGGAYDIDWDNQHDTIERNYAHDTQGYCISVFGAGYVTSDSIVRDNLCIDNGLSPRLAALQGAIYLSTWNGGLIRGLIISGNEIRWNPPVPGAAAIVGPGDTGKSPIFFTGNTVESTSQLIYRIKTPWQSTLNKYILDGQPRFSIGDKQNLTLDVLHAQGMETNSVTAQAGERKQRDSIRLEAWINAALDEDGFLSADAHAQLVVLRSLAGEYGPKRLKINVHLCGGANKAGENVLRDLEDVNPDSLHFAYDAGPAQAIEAVGSILLESVDGSTLQTWLRFQNAATLGGAVRKLLGPPDYSHMQPPEHHEDQP
jgi:hypothetical protein